MSGEVTARPAPKDAAARATIRDALDTTLVVEAAAGTGKTTALVGRIVALLTSGRATLGGIISVTFTDKAAGEMKLRLRAEIEKARTAARPDPASEARSEADAERSPVVHARLDRALAELETARIGTIHSLCADLLRERPIEARVDPLFEIAAQDDVRRIYGAAFDEWFQDVLAHPPEGVRRVLRRRPRGRGLETPRELLFDDGRRLAVELRDFDAPWTRRPIDRVAEIDRAIAALASLQPLAELCTKSTDFLAKSLQELTRVVADVRHRETVRARDYDALEAQLREVLWMRAWKWEGKGDWVVRGVLRRSETLAARGQVRAVLEDVVAKLDADLAACLRADLAPLVAAYDRHKRRAGKLDFLDLLLRTRDLVRDHDEVRRELQTRFSHVLVDEFQDTDPLQAEILLLLAANDPDERDWTRAVPCAGKLFVVGDPKQSIYRFRRADVALYEEVKRRLLDAGAELVHLSTSFRGRPELQSAINAAFRPQMQGSADGSQAAYVALEAARADRDEQPALVALPAPRPYSEWGKVTNWKVEESLPDAIGAFIDWLVRESGWKVTEREDPDQLVPIEARHVCLLFKRLTSGGQDVSRAYVRALEVRRIPHVLVGGRSFHEREEVLAMKNALSAIEWPDDELAVFATLRGPFFALGDDKLLAYRHALGPLHPLRRRAPSDVAAEHLAEVQFALDVLAELHKSRNWRPISDTIARFLDATRAHAGIAIWPSGEQALANLLRVTDLARRFEAGGATSFRAFVQLLEEEARSGEAGEAPVVEEGTEGVRMMTVHRAKGLEFPIVILVEPTAPDTRKEASRYVDAEKKLWAVPLAHATPIELIEHRDDVLARDRAEAVRLAYVAATRARDLLVVPVCGDEALDGWLSPLHDVVHPPAVSRRSPELAPSCPKFGGDSVAERPSQAPLPSASVAPGLHTPRAGTHRVVWWDPSALALGVEHDAGLRQQRILEPDARGVAEGAGERAHEAWARQRAEVLAVGGTPSIFVLSPSEDAAATIIDPHALRPAPVERTTVDVTGRPRGRRFGTLVHAVLAEVSLDADDRELWALARAEGRVLGADDAEIRAAVEAAGHALRHPLFDRARAAWARGECHRELPIALSAGAGALVDGVVDLTFRELGPEGPRWIVVDYKTDAELDLRRAHYDVQLGLYVQAIEAATGERAEAVLLAV